MIKFEQEEFKPILKLISDFKPGECFQFHEYIYMMTDRISIGNYRIAVHLPSSRDNSFAYDEQAVPVTLEVKVIRE